MPHGRAKVFGWLKKDTETMEHKDLIRMANQIASFFKAYPHDEAVKETAEHIKKFWEPRMRADLKKILDGGDKGLEGVALEAAKLAVS